jgi:hypothetical protein
MVGPEKVDTDLVKQFKRRAQGSVPYGIEAVRTKLLKNVLSTVNDLFFPLR